MADQTRLLIAIALSASLSGCGGAPPIPPDGHNPLNGMTPSECDQYSFIVAFRRSPVLTVTDIECKRIISPVDSIVQFFTEYSNGTTTLTYWANALPVRVDGIAPDCIRAKLGEVIPRDPLTSSECRRERLR